MTGTRHGRIRRLLGEQARNGTPAFVKVVLYSEHLSEEPGLDLRTVGERYRDLVEEKLEEWYPGADVTVVVLHGVSGVGAGVTVEDADGISLDDEVASIEHMMYRLHQSDELWSVLS